MAKTDTRESKTEAESTEVSFVKAWLDALDRASKDEEDWRKKADEAVEVFRGKRSQKATRFNIFFSNIETICPAVYNSTPEPDVRRRYNDDDPVGKQVADIIERALSYSVDMYDFDSTMRAIVRDGEIAGRGCPRVRYVPTFAKDEAGQEVVADEEVICDYVPWKQFRRGPGFLWSHIPWVAFGDYLSKEEVSKLVDEEMVREIPFNYMAGAKGEYKKVETREQSIFKRAFFWQIWDKETRRVIYVCPDYAKKAVRVIEDPLELTGFFPVPRPYQPVQTTDSLVPTVPYEIYEELVLELNDLTERITKLVKQCRPRALGVGNQNDLAAVAEAGDGEIKPVQMMEAFVQGKGLDSMISWFPLDPTVKALVQLVAQREQVKMTIYEVTGISDIIRGSTDADETATAQSLKAQWGSIRIQDRQAEVARVARDLFRLKAEIIATKFSPEKLTAMTGIQITPDIQALLRDDITRNYRIDIETDSTIRGDMMRNQQAMAEFINGTAQYAAAVAPITEQFPPLAQPFIEVYTAFARQFNLGKQAEDALDSLAEITRQAAAQQSQQEDQPSPEEMQMQHEAMMAERQQQIDAEDKKIANDREERRLQQELSEKQVRLEMDQETHQAELLEKEVRLQLDARDKGHDRKVKTDELKLKKAAHNKKMIEETEAATGKETTTETPSVMGVVESLGKALSDLTKSQQEAMAKQDAKVEALMKTITEVARIAAAPKEAIIKRDAAGKMIGATAVPRLN